LAHLAGLPPLAAATSQIELADAIAGTASPKIRRRIERWHAAALKDKPRISVSLKGAVER
jgi:hypothetical protein